jgi:YVTN family beta-propeller protein
MGFLNRMWRARTSVPKRLVCLVAALVCVFPPQVSAEVRGSLLVVNKSSDTVSAIALPEGRVVAELPTGPGPHEIAVSPDGSRAIVSNYDHPDTETGSLTLIDIPRGRVTATISLAPYQHPHGVAWLADNRQVLVTAEASHALLLIDTGEPETGVVAAIGTGQTLSHMVAVDAVRNRAYVTNIVSGSLSVLDLGTRKLTTVVPTGAGTEGLAVRPGSGEVWVTNREENTLAVVDPASLTVTRRIPTGDFPLRVRFTEDGRLCLVTNGLASSVSVVDADSGASFDVPLAGQWNWATGRNAGGWFGWQTLPVGVLTIPGTARAYVANSHGGVISVVDLQTREIVETLVAGAEPDGLAFSPDRFGATR